MPAVDVARGFVCAAAFYLEFEGLVWVLGKRELARAARRRLLVADLAEPLEVCGR